MRIWIFGVTNSNDVGQSPKRGIKMKCSYTLHVIINDGTQPNILTNLVNVTTSSVSVTHCHGVIVTFPPGNCPSLMHREVRFAPSSGIPFDSFFGHDFVVCFRRQVFGDFFLQFQQCFEQLVLEFRKRGIGRMKSDILILERRWNVCQ